MIEWIPIEQFKPSHYETTYLLWCPGLRVSGPVVVAYFQNNEWVVAQTGYKLITTITHYAEINGP